MNPRTKLRAILLCSAVALWPIPSLAQPSKAEIFKQFPCTNITGQRIDDIASHHLTADEVEALTARINTCFSDPDIRDRYVQELKDVSRRYPDLTTQIQNAARQPTEDDFFKRKQLQKDLEAFKHLPAPLNNSEKADRLARLANLRQSVIQLPGPYRMELQADLQGVQSDIAMSQVQQIEGMSCGQIRGQVQCAPECKIFLGMNTSAMPPDYIKRTSGKELKDWTDADFDTFHKNFITCHANSPRDLFAPEIQESAFSSFIDQKTDQLRRQRDALKGGEMEMASIPAECQADINALSGKQSDIALEIARVGTDIDQLFAAGAHDEACQNLGSLLRKLENTRSSMMRCRDNDMIKTSSHYPPILFLKGAAAFNQAEETFTRYGQTKGCD